MNIVLYFYFPLLITTPLFSLFSVIFLDFLIFPNSSHSLFHSSHFSSSLYSPLRLFPFITLTLPFLPFSSPPLLSLSLPSPQYLPSIPSPFTPTSPLVRPGNMYRLIGQQGRYSCSPKLPGRYRWSPLPSLPLSLPPFLPPISVSPRLFLPRFLLSPPSVSYLV